MVFRFGSELGLIGLEACLEPLHVETFFLKLYIGPTPRAVTVEKQI